MRLFLHTLVFLLFAFQIQATGHNIEAAQNLAKKYCQNPSLKKTGLKPSSPLRSASERDSSYFIFSDDATDMFCIVSADARKVLGYGNNYTEELPQQLQAILDTYAASPQPVSELRSSTTREDIPPFMDVVFGTRSPYNKYIPDRDGYGPPVGCVPVTLAQIAKYYEYPSKLMNDIPGYAHISSTDPDTIYQIEGQEAEGRTYDWDLILNHYEKDTTEALNNEVAKLMWDCARSVETAFAQSGSSALTSMFFYSLIHYFGYNSDSLKQLSRASYYREEWLDIIHGELSKKRPIYMSGTSYNHGGHAFICDGYIDGYLHINWGWNGSCDGYFDIDILDYNRNKDKEQSNPERGYNFSEIMIIGIVPGEGTTKYERPKSSSSIIQQKKESFSVDARYRATNDGFVMYTSIDAYNPQMNDENKFFAIGYSDKNGNISFLSNGESDYFYQNSLNLNTKRDFNASYLGNEITLYVLESDNSDIETLIQDTIYNWWHPSSMFEPITIKIPDSIVNSNELIVPEDIELLGEYSDSTITLKIKLQAERPKGSMKYIALAIVVDGDTLMSESNDHFFEFDENILKIKRSFKNPNLDNTITLIALQKDSIPLKYNLDKSEWTLYENFEPLRFLFSDCKITSKEMQVDTIVHTTRGRTQRFEITFSNPTPFEYYNDVYFIMDKEDSGVMLHIPAGGTSKKIIEREQPLLTKYINNFLAITTNNHKTIFEFTKDTFSHVFYGFGGGDETTLAIQILNSTNKKYDNTFVLRCDSDSISSQTVTIEPISGVQINYALPPTVSDTSFIPLDLKIYSFFDKDNNLLGEVTPNKYYGRVYQYFHNNEKFISINLRPIEDSIMPPLLIGITSSLEDSSAYQRLIYTPDTSSSGIFIDFRLSDYCSLEKPKYIGLCKEDGTFYAYMELLWDDGNSSPNIPSNGISIIAVDGGIWISSDVDIPSLPIYNVKGNLIQTVELKQNSSLFVPLPKGIYIAGNKKILITS